MVYNDITIKLKYYASSFSDRGKGGKQDGKKEQGSKSE